MIIATPPASADAADGETDGADGLLAGGVAVERLVKASKAFFFCGVFASGQSGLQPYLAAPSSAFFCVLPLLAMEEGADDDAGDHGGADADPGAAEGAS